MLFLFLHPVPLCLLLLFPAPFLLCKEREKEQYSKALKPYRGGSLEVLLFIVAGILLQLGDCCCSLLLMQYMTVYICRVSN